jgi:hypothetical protein
MDRLRPRIDDSRADCLAFILCSASETAADPILVRNYRVSQASSDGFASPGEQTREQTKFAPPAMKRTQGQTEFAPMNKSNPSDMAARRMGGHGRSPNGGTSPHGAKTTSLQRPCVSLLSTRMVHAVESLPLSALRGPHHARVMSSRVKSLSSIPHRFSAMNLMQQRSVTSFSIKICRAKNVWNRTIVGSRCQRRLLILLFTPVSLPFTYAKACDETCKTRGELGNCLQFTLTSMRDALQARNIHHLRALSDPN